MTNKQKAKKRWHDPHHYEVNIDNGNCAGHSPRDCMMDMNRSSNKMFCCRCISPTSCLIVTAVISIVTNVTVSLLVTFCYLEPNIWFRGHRRLERWLVSNNWDVEITTTMIEILNTLSNNLSTLIFPLILFYNFLHIITACGILKGATYSAFVESRRVLILPWLILDSISTSILATTFTIMAFITFFIHIVIAILFPIIAGIILGYWIYVWKNVQIFFTQTVQRSNVVPFISSPTIFLPYNQPLSIIVDEDSLSIESITDSIHTHDLRVIQRKKKLMLTKLFTFNKSDRKELLK